MGAVIVLIGWQLVWNFRQSRMAVAAALLERNDTCKTLETEEVHVE
jgi:hypothetical protein